MILWLLGNPSIHIKNCTNKGKLIVALVKKKTDVTSTYLDNFLKIKLMNHQILLVEFLYLYPNQLNKNYHLMFFNSLKKLSSSIVKRQDVYIHLA